MSLYDLPREMLVKIIEKMERPVYILKVRRIGSSKHHMCDKLIGPFYNLDEIGKYFKMDSSSLNYYFKKHKEFRDSDYIYELDKLTYSKVSASSEDT